MSSAPEHSRPRKTERKRRLGIRGKISVAVVAVFALQIATALAGFYWMSRIEGIFRYVSEQTEPALAAAYEMEINVIGAGLGVAKYLQKPDPAYRARFEEDSAEFRHFLDRYKAAATSPSEQDLAGHIESLQADYARLGGDLMALEDRDTSALQSFAETISLIDKHMGSELPDPSFLPQVRGANSLRWIVATMQSDVAEAVLSLVQAHNTLDADSQQRAEREWAEIRQNLKTLQSYALPSDWREWAIAMAALCEKAFSAMTEATAVRKAIEDRFGRFVELRTRMDDLLDERIQAMAVRDFAHARYDKANAIAYALYTLIALSLSAAALAAVGSLLLGRHLLRPIATLADAAEKLRLGHFEHRVEVKQRDEIGVLERSFNEMVESLQQADRQLRAINRDLESRVAARTRDLTRANDQLARELERREAVEEELRDAANRAEAASRAKSAFLANMSHELRTPLNAIIGFSEVMKRELLGPMANRQYREYAGDILQCGNHLLKLINDLLDLSRIEAGKLRIVFETIDPSELVESALRYVGVQAEQAEVELKPLVQRNLPRLSTDRMRVEQMLINLLSNGIKFTAAGGRVLLRARHRQANGGAIEFSVIDRGPGIAPSDMAKILVPFGRTEAAIARDQAGIGLGLPLTRAFAEMIGGKLALRSRPGHGTTATLLLPITGADRRIANEETTLADLAANAAPQSKATAHS
jgi:signal transduction histidine kinase